MSSNDKKLTPQLRFKEFKNSGEWEEKKLGKLILDINERNNSNLTKVLSVTNAYGIVEQEDFFQKIVASEDLSNYKVIRKGDIAYNPSRINIGSVDILHKYKLGIMSPMYVIVRCKENILDNFFLKQWLISGTFYLLLEKYLQGGVRKSLPYNLFKNIDILIPSFKEQQKIADFLLSVDELIMLEKIKLEKLKEYKKGLLQNLFPKENQKVPDLRFSDFKNSGDWEEKKLGDIGEIITGKTPSTSDRELWKDEIAFVTPSDIKGNKYQYITERMVTNINIKLLPVGTIMFSCIATIGKIAIAKAVCTTNQQINSIIIDVENINNEFVYYSLQSIISKIKAKYEKDAFSIINKTEFSNIIIQVSPLNAEQKKIADFLASVDELIDNEKNKLENLKEYKKGLLQKLFPQGDI